jgi:GTPase SAR1 family protein
MSDSRGFEAFLATRERLAGMLTETAETIGEVGGGAERAKRLGEARETLMQDAFRLMVVGEFKRGKSTLVNSLLGKDVLPARVAPCTAIITEVKYADAPKAVLHFVDASRSPMDVDVERLRDYVVIEDEDDSDDDSSDQIARSPYSLMELYYPLPLCRNNVQIVDSPGLNEHRTRTKIAVDFLTKADALVLVLSCQQALSQSELTFIDNDLGGRNLNHVFFVWNHFDAIADSPEDITDIRKRSDKYLEPRVGRNARIFYVSARDALVGKKAPNAAKLERSGLVPFEAALEGFLATERGRVKIQAPLRMAQTAVREALAELIPRAESMLSQPLEQLLKTYEAQRPRLEELETQRERMLRTVERRRDALIREVSASHLKFVSDVELEVRAEVERVEVGAWEATKSRKGSHDKIVTHLQSWLEQRAKTWREQDLDRIFESNAKDLDADIEEQSRGFMTNVDAIREALAPKVGSLRAEDDLSGTNRVLSAVGGLFIGGIGSAIEGAGMGFKGMAKGLVLNIGLIVGLVFIGGFGAPVVIPVLAAVGLIRTALGAKSTVEKLKEQVTREFSTELRKGIPETVAAITSRTTEEFKKLSAQLDAGLSIHIEELSGQIQAILKAKQQGEEHLKQEQARLAEARQKLVRIAKELDGVQTEIDGRD